MSKLLPWKLCESAGEYWYKIPTYEASLFRELCRRVVMKEDFTSFAKKIWKEVFGGK